MSEQWKSLPDSSIVPDAAEQPEGSRTIVLTENQRRGVRGASVLALGFTFAVGYILGSLKNKRRY